MIIDALFVGEPHFSHLCVEEALDFIEVTKRIYQSLNWKLLSSDGDQEELGW